MIASAKFEKTSNADWETIESITQLRRNNTKNYFGNMKDTNEEKFTNVMSALDNNKQKDIIQQKNIGSNVQ